MSQIYEWIQNRPKYYRKNITGSTFQSLTFLDKKNLTSKDQLYLKYEDFSSIVWPFFKFLCNMIPEVTNWQKKALSVMN